MSSYTFGDSSLQCTLTQEEKHLTFSVKDKVNGIDWGTVPLLELEIYSKAEFRAQPIRDYRVDQIEEIENGLHISIGEGFWGVRIGLWLRVIDGELRIRMPMSEVYEDKEQTCRLFSVILLPGLMSCNSAGRMLLPLNCGILSHPKDKPALQDRFMIFGEQSRWELLPTLPLCAVERPEGSLMAMTVGAPGETECHVKTDGNGNGCVGFGMSLRQFWPDPVEFETREVLYRPIPAKEDFILHTAKRLRRHVLEDHGKPTLRQRCEESPELKYMLDGYTMKLFFAVENVGIMMYGKEKGSPITFNNVMRFDEAKNNLKRLHAAGVGNIYCQCVGWNPNGHDGRYPTHFPIEERLGGEKAFRDLIASATEMGYMMNVHDNVLAGYRQSPDFDEERMVHDQWGGIMGLGEWGGGITYVVNRDTYSDEEMLNEFARVKGLGLSGMGYLDGMGNPLYRDYHPRHKLTRTGYANMTNRCIDLARKAYGAAGTECGFLYCAIAADSLCTGGEVWQTKLCWPEWPITHLMDKRVPVWELAMHGLVFKENIALGWHALMETVLLGDHPRDEWSARPGVMPVLTDARIAQIKAVYDIALKQYGHLALEELTSYNEVNGIAESSFADGTQVRVDFNEERLFVNNAEIKRPEAL